jgi:hypothetical protein
MEIRTARRVRRSVLRLGLLGGIEETKTLEAKQTGERSAGNPHAAFDVGSLCCERNTQKGPLGAAPFFVTGLYTTRPETSVAHQPCRTVPIHYTEVYC